MSKLIRTFASLLLLACGFPDATSAFTMSPDKQEFTSTITALIINNQYDQAITLIDSTKNSEDDPLWPVLKLAAIGMRDVDFEKIIDSTEFLKIFATTQSTLARYENKHGENSYLVMLTGLSKAIHATFYLRQKKYFGAMQHGFDALDKMKKAQELDSLNYEVDFFLGLYEYARSELHTKLWWVLFWYAGDREEGIRRIIRCAAKASITADAASLSLCDIYLQNKEMQQSHNQIMLLKNKFPASRFVLWAEVKYFEAGKAYKDAADRYGKLSDSYSREPVGEYNALYTATRQAAMLLKADCKKEANTLCRELLQNKKNDYYGDLKKELKKIAEQCNVPKN